MYYKNNTYIYLHIHFVPEI